MKLVSFLSRRVAIYLLATVLIILTSISSVFAQQADFIKGELLVRLRSTPTATEKRSERLPVLKDFPYGEAFGQISQLGVTRVKLHEGVSMQTAMNALRLNPQVAYVEQNGVLNACTPPNDPSYATLQYGPQIIKADMAWDIWKPKEQTIIAIADTGVDYNHPDLTDKLLRDSSDKVIGYNAVNDSDNANDDHFHGTHCAGIAAASVNNEIGIAGVAGWNPLNSDAQSFIKIMPIKVLGADGSGSDFGVANGIIWAADHGAKVVSLSLGGFGYSQTLADAVAYARRKDVNIVAAAGNSATNSLFFPAAYSGVISVGATDRTDTLASFSNYGSWVKVAAPGVGIYSTFPGGGYEYLSGTSMSCPHVAGEAALLRAQNPVLYEYQIADIIVKNVDEYKPFSGRFIANGAGRVNILKALQSNAYAPPTVTSLFFSTGVVTNPSRVTGILRLSRAPQRGGVTATISYSSTSSLVNPPTSVFFPEGVSRASFTIDTAGVSADTLIQVTATTDPMSVSTTLTLKAPVLSSVNVNPTSVLGGTSCTGLVTLSALAPEGGITVTLASSSPLVTTPATVTIPARASSATFPLTVSPAAESTVVAVSATLGDLTKTAHLTVRTPDLVSIRLSPSQIKAGGSSTGTVTLSGVTAIDTVIMLTSSNKAATVPTTVIVAAGQSSATFTVNTISPQSSRTFGNIVATQRFVQGSVSKTVSVVVNP
jgi:thermitase